MLKAAEIFIFMQFNAKAVSLLQKQPLLKTAGVWQFIPQTMPPALSDEWKLHSQISKNTKRKTKDKRVNKHKSNLHMSTQ